MKTTLIYLALIVSPIFHTMAGAQGQTSSAVQSIPCWELPNIPQLESFATTQVLAAYGYNLRQPYDCSKLESRWYGDNIVLLFRSIANRLDRYTSFALVLGSQRYQVWVIPIESGMLEYPHLESDPHNLAAFNLLLAERQMPNSETEWKSLALSYLALIGHGLETPDAKVSCKGAECSIEILNKESARAATAWTLFFGSQGQVVRLEYVSKEVQVKSKKSK